MSTLCMANYVANDSQKKCETLGLVSLPLANEVVVFGAPLNQVGPLHISRGTLYRPVHEYVK